MTDLERYVALIFLGPLLWLEGKYVRHVTPHLPEPPGIREGTTGQGPLLRLLIAGDSAAAGVGAATQSEALSGRLVAYLQQHRTVEWQLLAINGLDSPGLVNLLQDASTERFDAVVLSVGVNDVTSLRSPSQWVQWQDKLANVIQSRFAPQLLIHSAIPPMHGFTALPQPLRWFMGRWAIEMNRRLEAALSGRTGRILHWPFREAGPDGLAADGFHPGPVGYDLWAQGLSRVILLYSGGESRPNQ